MLRKNYSILLLTVALFLASGMIVFAQTAPVRGKVVIKKADGTTVPVADALVEVFRTDIVGKFPSAKTNKNGEFSFAGFPPGARVALSVSAPGVRSDIYPDIKGGDENLTLTVSEGDGKQFTEQEVRTMLSNAPKDVQTGKLTEEQKKQQEEFEKKNAEILAGNKKAENVNAIVNKAQTEGNKAYNDKNYDLAIASYDEGINADPDFEGSAPVLLNNKSSALIRRAVDKYNAAIKGDPNSRAAALELVKKDLSDAVTASNRSLQILKTATNTDPKVQKAYVAEKSQAYQNTMDGYSKILSMNIDGTKGKELLTALDEYMAVETDAAKKSQWQLVIADALRLAGDSPNAIIAYRRVLETSPENPDALAGLGLSLFSAGAGVVPENTAQMQEGLNYMQRFTEVAPETHPLKASVKDAVDYLKTKQLTPQKTTKATTKKKT